MSANKQRKKLAERRRQQKRLRHSDREAWKITPGETDVRRSLREQLCNVRKPTNIHPLAPAGIVWQANEWDRKILERGSTIASSTVKRLAGQPHLCHENCAAFFWLNLPKYQIATGYVYQNGLWGPHSWLMDGDTILETTTVRDMYFGMVMDELEASQFVVNKLMSILQECGLNVETESGGKRVIITAE